MRRVGNRLQPFLQLAIKRWKRGARKVELFRFRQRWAEYYDEYECVGGLLDGHIRRCMPNSIVPTPGGYYSIDQSDCRLHFHMYARITSWRGQ